MIRKILQLEGIRGIGALIVFTVHFYINFSPQFYAPILALLKNNLPLSTSLFILRLLDLYVNGNIFLHVFWALSAYVIFKKFFELRSKGETLWAGVIKRYFRLMLPCAFATFCSYLLLRSGQVYINDIHHAGTMVGNDIFPVYNFTPSIYSFLKSSVFGNLFHFDYKNLYDIPLWTIEKEFYGSVFCFALFGITRLSRNRSFWYIGIFICVFMARLYWLNSFLFGYYLSDLDFSTTESTNFISAFVKRVNTVLINNQAYSLLVLVLLFTGLRYIFFKRAELFDPVNSISGLILILATLRIDRLARLMEFKPIARLGRLSFGLYVLHWPVMCSFTSWCYLKFDHSGSLSLLVLYLATLVLSLLLAWAFHVFIDMRSVKIAGKISSYFSPELPLHEFSPLPVTSEA